MALSLLTHHLKAAVGLTIMMNCTGAWAADDPREAVAGFLPTCEPRFAEIDARVAKAGVADATYARIEGFPYLRADRLLASFEDELDDPDIYDTWLLALRDNDTYSRNIELTNLGLSLSERATLINDMRLCAVWLSFFELGEPERLRSVLKQLRALRDEPGDAAAAKVPLTHSKSTTKATDKTHFAPPHNDGIDLVMRQFALMPRDELKRVGLTVDGWRALAEHHAPTLLIGNAKAPIAPGALHWKDAKTLALDPAKPTLYYHPHFARVGDQSLIQFHYFAWFALPDGKGVDGLVWRVTLDLAGKPLVYDQLRADGSSHRWYPAQKLQAKQTNKAQSGAVVGTDGVTIELPAHSGDVVTILPHANDQVRDNPSEERQFRLEPYEDLMTLARPDGSSQSAYTAEGHLRLKGPQGRTIAQWGRHPTLPGTGQHYDDPRLIESTFEIPTALLPALRTAQYQNKVTQPTH